MSAVTRRRIFGAAAILAVLNLSVYFAYTFPRSLQKRNVAARVQQLEGELQQERLRFTELQTRSETILANRKESRAFLEERVKRPDAALGPMLTEVESLARQQGLKIGSQGFDRERVKGLPLERFGITMPVTGTYGQVAGLVHELEHSSHFLTLDRIGAQKQGEEGEGTVDLSLAFSAYFRADAEGKK